MKNTLHRRIMRRIYYAFALKMLTHRILASGVLLTASVYGLSVFVHVASIFENLRRIQLGRLDNFIVNAFIHTDVFTLIFFALVVVSALSFNRALLSIEFPQLRRVSAV